ncbi:MAG: crosslink repair DNA glycosylase YcaQ family protein [Parvularculaceae bacterium]
MPLTISNRDARRLWLDRQGLGPAPTGPAGPEALMAEIRRLGFVQIDTVRVLARAHDHIMWTRKQAYREGMLDDLVKAREAFEHYTHDASILPMEVYPYWTRQYDRLRRELDGGSWREAMADAHECDAMLKRIEREGALSTRDFEAAEKKSDHAWARPPHKVALDYFWYAGVLATCHRRNFIKHYDLAERIIPEKHRKKEVSDARQIDWLCANALHRLGFASEGDLQRFWDAVELDEVKGWVKKKRKALIDVEIVGADREIYTGFAPADIEEQIAALDAPTSRLRLLNPFDPVVRDRNRLQRLFGFDYRNEMFTPAAKRQFGYYVYPMLEGDRFVGRLEAKADRKKGRIDVLNLWWERGVKPTPARLKKLDAELERMGRFIDARDVSWKAKRA